MPPPDHHLPHFLPYLLNQAAEAVSAEFQAYYKARYDMLRTEWRVLFHLGCYGAMTAKQICDKSQIHKTKVSRAVSALAAKSYIKRMPDPADRRIEHLSLTPLGDTVFADLSQAAADYDARIMQHFQPDEARHLRDSLLRLINGDRIPFAR